MKELLAYVLRIVAFAAAGVLIAACAGCGSITDRFALPAHDPARVTAVVPQVLEASDLDHDGLVRTAEEQATFSLLLRLAVATRPRE